jgi:Bifunctional DNA primase/polymerase, N-terminal
MSSDQVWLEYALRYASMGWPVLPLHWPTAEGCSCGDRACNAIGKHPLLKHGLYEASTSGRVIRRWADRWPEANVGIRTGLRSGLLVLDVDGEAGRESFRLLEERHGRLGTYGVRTGSGFHLYFEHRGSPLGNSVGRFAPGIDVRGENGYVVAPPSVHASGVGYVGFREPEDLLALPAWVENLLRPRRRAEAAFRTRPRGARSCREGQVREPRAAAYGIAAAMREAAIVAGTAEGERNDALNRAAFKLGRLVVQEYLAEVYVRDELLAAAAACGLDEHEAERTITSGLTAGLLSAAEETS